MAGHGFGPDFYNLVLNKAQEPLSDLSDFFAQNSPKSQPTDALPDVNRNKQYRQDFAQSPIAQAFYNASGGTALSAISTPKMPGASTLPYFGPGVDIHGAAVNPRDVATPGQAPQKDPMIWTPTQGVTQAPAQAPQSSTTPNPTDSSYAPTGRNIAPQQFGDPTLSFSDAVAACGPTAAIAFLHQTGRNMTVSEATAIARNNGLWDQGVGMHGPDAERQLLSQMGIQSEVDYTPSPDEIVSRIHNGEAVIVSSPGYNHYFVITDYNPQTNMFYVGNTGNVWRDKSRNADWLSFGQIMPQASIYFAPGQVSDALSDTNGTQQQPQATPQNIHDSSSAAPQATQDGRIAATSVYGDDASRKQAYVTAMYPLAQQYEQQTGIPAELFLAIGGSESNFGNAPGYSLFGIMAGQGEQRAGVGTSDGNLKGYNSLDESMNDFAQLMLSRRYRPAVDAYQSGQVDLRGMIAMIRDAGYDSPNDPNYQRWPDLVMGALGQVQGYIPSGV